MSDLLKAFSIENLKRSWRWLNTNQSIKYKNYFRDSYVSYSFNLNENIRDLSERLKKGTYSPGKPSLILQPKTSCTTRPITLLTVEDQIVYQALINVIADKGYNKLKKRYYRTTFGNLYAGKNQLCFYRNWKKSYTLFNKKIMEYHNDGKVYIASFDLTSCFDSIDHKVLSYRLEVYNLEKEFIGMLIYLLENWSTNKQIFKGHGIPQGPISSGLLSEIMLSYYDEEFEKLKLMEIEYIRYVDDIVLMGESKEELTYALSTLDYRSKLIGLFPQSAKIKIRKIYNIEDELNIVSDLNIEIIAAKYMKKYKKLEKSFKKVYKGNKIIDKTKFKIILPSMKSSAKVANLSIDLLGDNPQYFDTVGYYLSKYNRKIPSSTITKIIEVLGRIDTYQVTKAILIEAVYEKLKDVDKNRFQEAVIKLKVIRRYSNPYLNYVILKYLLANGMLKYSELLSELSKINSWWVKKSILKYIDVDYYGVPSYYGILREYMTSCTLDCIIEAGKLVIENDIEVDVSKSELNYMATKMLRTNGIINRAKSRPSYISDCLDVISGSIPLDFNWKRVAGQQHSMLENKYVRARTYFESDINAFINIIDTIDDILIDLLAKHDPTVGKYQLGNIGGFLNAGSRFNQKYPQFFMMCKEIHDKRLECELSHAVHKKSKKPTQYIPYRYRYNAARLIGNGMSEFIQLW